MKQKSAWIAVVLAGTLAGAAGAADWPQWRGPHRDGKSPDSGLLAEWPEGGPPLAFQASGFGSGYSSVAVAGERIYTMGDLDEKQYVIAASRKDGSPVWKTAVGPAWDDRFLGSRSTPTVDGDRVYALSTEGALVCLKAEDGALVWKRDLTTDFSGGLMIIQGTHWKFSESPLVDGDRVVVTPGHAEAGLVALDKKTGKELWRTKLPDLGEEGADGAGYSSIVVGEGGGVRQYVQLLGRGVVGVAADTGRLLWSYNRIANEVANIPTPIVSGDYVLTSTGYDTGGTALLALKATEGGGVSAEEVWFHGPSTMQNHHGGMLLLGDYLYMGSGHNKGLPLAAEWRTGKVAWGPVRNQGKSSAAVAYADGRLYFRYQDGWMVLIEANPEKYVERGSFRIPEVKRESWSHPVVIDGRLYLKEQDTLYVYDVSAPKKGG